MCFVCLPLRVQRSRDASGFFALTPPLSLTTPVYSEKKGPRFATPFHCPSAAPASSLANPFLILPTARKKQVNEITNVSINRPGILLLPFWGFRKENRRKRGDRYRVLFIVSYRGFRGRGERQNELTVTAYNCLFGAAEAKPSETSAGYRVLIYIVLPLFLNELTIQPKYTNCSPPFAKLNMYPTKYI